MGSYARVFWEDKRGCEKPNCQRLAVYPTSLCKKHQKAPEELAAKAQEALLKEVKGGLPSLKERFDAACGGNLLDMHVSLGWLAAYRDTLVDRAIAQDVPRVRERALVALKMGQVEKAQEILQQGVNHDQALKEIATFAQKMLESQARVAEIRLRQEANMTPQQVMLLLQGSIQIVAQICGAQQAQRVVAEIYKGLLNRQPKLALTGMALAEENSSDA